MRTLQTTFLRAVSLVVLVACADAPPARAPVAAKATAVAEADCGPAIAGFDQVARRPVVMLGEMHGQGGPPAFAIDFACRVALASHQAVLALELPKQEQARLDAYLASDGGAAAREALLGGEFWTRAYQDGRSSAAMLALVEKGRMLVRAGLPLKIVAVDDSAVEGQAPREQAMADGLLAQVRANHGPVVMLVGNYHAHTAPGAPWDPQLRFMGVHVKQAVPEAIGLDVRYGKGDSWICMSAEATECGSSPTKGHDVGDRWTIELFPAPNEGGLGGTFSVGPAVASEPARGLSIVMQAALTAREFRKANKPRMADGFPSESALGPEERDAWCQKLLPFARQRIALIGDSLTGAGPCFVTLVPEPKRQRVPDVEVRFDLRFFFTKPYAAASYDRESRALYLPLAALSRPWDEVSATRHEWRHANHHAVARRGDATASALQTVISGADYRPDGFYADEVPVNLCDAVQAAGQGAVSADQLKMAEQYLEILTKELGVMKSLAAKPAGLAGVRTRAGVAGTTLSSTDGVDRWLGGKDAKRSLMILESVRRDASTALARLRAVPPDVAGAAAVPLLAGDACEASPH